MPLYEYDCKVHGVFEAMHGMQTAADPERCPECGDEAPRVLSVPRLACVGTHERIARDRNERSRHEPQLSRPAPRAPVAERPALRASHGSRPWVLEHG
jgi:putative FmdB family regulatory protein